MAKALMGHMANDHGLRAEVISLRARVRALEAEVEKLRNSTVMGQPVTLTDPVKVTDLDSELVELGRATPALA